ncbi:Crp/Fnr family transcriptional regulator [Dissulfurispira thermophila]|nr:Crp/Fnr family transcriptional regulator [Dissulfurispira thermophila]
MKTLSRDTFIEIFPFFRKAPDSLIEEILSTARYQAFLANTIVYTEGDSCSSIALLLSGEIRVYKIGENGREITLYEIGAGETCILNASCILSSKKYPAHALSTKGGKMMLIPSREFRGMVARYEDMRDFIFGLLSDRLTAVMALVEDVAFGRMDERLIDYIIEKSEDGILNATHQKIASDLGTSREVVSRLLKDFERKGKVILSRNSIQLKN